MSDDPTYRFSDHAMLHRLDPEKVKQYTLRAFEILMRLSLLDRTVHATTSMKGISAWADRFWAEPEDADTQEMLKLHQEFETLVGSRPRYVDVQARQDYQHRDSGHQLLHVAVECGLQSEVKHLLQNGAPINSPSQVGGPLAIAIRHKDMPMIDLLLDKGADIEGTHDGASVAIDQVVYRERPLHVAAGTNQPEVIAQLVRHDATINVMGIRGETPLGTTLFGSKLEAAKMLLDLGANPNLIDTSHRANEPLVDAAQIGSDRILSLLLDYGADMRCCVSVSEDLATQHIIQINATDAGPKYRLLINRWEEAGKMWKAIEQSVHDKSFDCKTLSVKDLVYCANIGMLDAVMHPQVWQASPSHIITLMPELPVWMQHNFCLNYQWVAQQQAEASQLAMARPNWCRKLANEPDQGASPAR